MDELSGERRPTAGATTITIPIERYDRLRREVIEAQSKAEFLRRELEFERVKTTEQRLTEALDFIEAMKTIADHACANLSPEFIRDLPAEAFATAAQHVAKIMGATQRDGERAAVWLERSQLIQAWRDKRKSRGWGEDATPPAAAKPRRPKAKQPTKKRKIR